MLNALPLTRSGKVDRGALPPPAHGRPELEASFVAPRSTDEHLLETIWRELLNIDSIGIHDDFFELGGHSLLATQMITQISKMFSVRIPLRAVFEHPTIAGVAETIRTMPRGDTRERAIPAQPRKRRSVTVSNSGILDWPGVP
jgi:acyl carrier protein